jgi:hypothetical protein
VSTPIPNSAASLQATIISALDSMQPISTASQAADYINNTAEKNFKDDKITYGKDHNQGEFITNVAHVISGLETKIQNSSGDAHKQLEDELANIYKQGASATGQSTSTFSGAVDTELTKEAKNRASAIGGTDSHAG